MNEIADPDLKHLASYWHSKAAAAAGRPTRSQIDPTEMTHLLQRMLLVDVLRHPLRFRYRLVGTAVNEAVGRDATGRHLDESLYGASTPAIHRSYARVVETGAPHHGTGELHFADQRSMPAEVVMLPIFTVDQVAVILLGLALSKPKPHWWDEPNRQPFEIRTSRVRRIDFETEANLAQRAS